MTTPLLIGVYKTHKLIKSYKFDEQTSIVLPKIFKKLDEIYDIKGLFYAKGPGSFMAIKLSYIFLKSYAITKNIPLKAVDGFYFNNNSPIKAIGRSYFIKEDDNIILDTITPKKVEEFHLPNYLAHKDFSTDNLPLYILPAV